MRIASLLPSATDIVVALGRADDLVAVTFECTVPDSLRDRVGIVVGGRDTSDLTPGEIDHYVREQVRLGADLYTLRRNALAALAPEVILTQDLCRVCALPAGAVSAALDHLGCQADVVTLDPHSLDDVLAGIRTVGRTLGADAEADELVEALVARLDAVRASVRGRPRPTMAIIEWIDPVFGAGHWIPDLVEAAGGSAVACRPHERSVPISWDDIRSADPDVVVVAPCGYGLDGAVAQAEAIAAQVPRAALWAIDADALIVRAAPGLVDGVEALASIAHPGVVMAPAGSVASIS